MDLPQIALFVLIALLYSAFLPASGRRWALMLISVLAIYWLQPDLGIRWLDYSLPTLTLGLTLAGWWFTRPVPVPNPANEASATLSIQTRQDALSAVLIIAMALLLTLPRYLNVPPVLQLTTRPPEVLSVILSMALGAGVVLALRRWQAGQLGRLMVWGMLALVLIFVLVKTPAFAQLLAGFLRGQAGQDVSLASPLDVEWLGFSYVAFRLLQTLRDRQLGILPVLSLRDYVSFVIFFPAYTAGPIDRAERFQTDLNKLTTLQGLDPQRWSEGLMRIAIGMGKKFIIADSLALVSLSAQNATQATGAPALWLMLYAYALRLFFDFSGYSDIAIGIARLLGIQLPENFDRPYTKHNLALFWQSWHMSLSAWVRAYVFAPLSRALLRREPKLPNDLITFICHLSTMALIGLWHGVTLPFLLWGLWHGVGLWVHKLWSDRTRKWYMSLKDKPRTKQAWTLVGWFITFHYVLIGWLFFALPDIDNVGRVLAGLIGR